MAQFGEKTAQPQKPPKRDKNEPEKKIKIRYALFFDGTSNNVNNINARLVSVDPKTLTLEEKKTAADLKNSMDLEQLKKAHHVYSENKGGDNSYENGYTNIVKLERHFDDKPQGDYAVQLSTYVDGAGTENDESDSLWGYAFGLGQTGIKAKIKKAVDEILPKIKDALNSAGGVKIVIEELTFDLFGFSRGAATARHFVSATQADSSKHPIKSLLLDQEIEVDKLNYHFVGLFDTVSSHGFYFGNDVSRLGLDQIKNATKVVQLAAADEHRKNFALTDVVSCKASKDIKSDECVQVYLPGVHSDIGGSYRDGASEMQDIYQTWAWGMAQCRQQAEYEKQRLLASGWYKEPEITITEYPSMEVGDAGNNDLDQAILSVKRASISNQYSRIPLHIMADFATEHKVMFKPRLKKDEAISANLEEAETAIKNYIDDHKNRDQKSPEIPADEFSSKASDWHDNDRLWLKKLRHEQLHFSARLKFGLGPRFENNERKRQIING